MRRIYIRLRTDDEVIPNGWTASIAITHQFPEFSEVADGESIIYNSKQEAWDSIINHAERLNYEINQIFFNGQEVDSFTTVAQMVQDL